MIKLANTLQQIAQDELYNAAAIRKAKALPYMDQDDILILEAYQEGLDVFSPFHHRLRLQEIANKIIANQEPSS